MASAPHIVVSGVSRSYEHRGRALLALDRTDLTVGQGEFVSVIGPSGCGKTTLLRIIGGLLEPATGSVTLAGRGPREAQRQKQIGFVFQDPSLLPWRSVLDNVRLPLQMNRRDARDRHVTTSDSRAKTPSPSPLPPGERGSSNDLVDLVGLREFARSYPHELSGGMKQRVALARALVFDPALLLMDEPLGSLDEITRSQMRYELLRIWERDRKTVLMVTHSIAEAALLSDRVVVLTDRPGRICGDVRIDLPRPRDPGIERTPAFLDLAGRIQELLAQGGRVGAASA